MQEPFERIAALEKALRELLKLWSDFAKPNEKQAAAWEELKSRRGQEAKITPQIAAAIVAHATNENERAARAALAGEKEAATSLMGMRVVSDPSVPVGEVHIRNIVPPAPAPVADEAVTWEHCPHTLDLTVCESCLRAALAAARAEGEKRGMERAAKIALGAPGCRPGVGDCAILIGRAISALAEQPEKTE